MASRDLSPGKQCHLYKIQVQAEMVIFSLFFFMPSYFLNYFLHPFIFLYKNHCCKAEVKQNGPSLYPITPWSHMTKMITCLPAFPSSSFLSSHPCVLPSSMCGLSVSICVHMCVGKHMYCAQACVCVHGGQRLTLDSFLSHSPL